VLVSVLRLYHYQELKNNFKPRVNDLCRVTLYFANGWEPSECQELRIAIGFLTNAINDEQNDTSLLEVKIKDALNSIRPFSLQFGFGVIIKDFERILSDVIWLKHQEQRSIKVKEGMMSFFNPEEIRKSKLMKRAKSILFLKHERRVLPERIVDDVESNTVFLFLNNALASVKKQRDQAGNTVHPITPEKSQASTAEPSPEIAKSSDVADLAERGQLATQALAGDIEAASDGSDFSLHLSSSGHSLPEYSPASLPDSSSEEDEASRASESGSDSGSDSKIDSIAHPNASRVNSSDSSLSSYISNDEYKRRYMEVEEPNSESQQGDIENQGEQKLTVERMKTHLLELSMLNRGKKVAPEDDSNKDKNPLNGSNI